MGFLSGWTYRIPVFGDNTLGLNALSGAQVNISLTASNAANLFTNALSTGFDLQVTDSDGTTTLPFWRESYSQGGQTASLWVKLATLAAAGSGIIWVYYGKAGASDASSYSNTFQKYDATEPGTLCYYAFDEASGTPIDATGLTTATVIGSPTRESTDGGNWKNSGTRQVFASGHCLAFSGATTQGITFANLLVTPGENGTIEFWFRNDTTNPSGTARLFSKVWGGTGSTGGGQGNTLECHWDATNHNISVSRFVDNVSMTLTGHTTSWPSGTWHHYALVWTPNYIAQYIDGQLDAQNRVDGYGDQAQPKPGSNANPFALGSYYQTNGALSFSDPAPQNPFQGAFDEFRVLNYAMRPDQIHADFRRSKYVQGTEECGRWAQGQRSTALNPSGVVGSYDPYQLIESSVLYDATLGDYPWQMWHSSNDDGSPDHSVIGYARSKDGIKWVKIGTVIASFASQSCVFKNLSGQYQIYYVDGYVSTTNVYTRTSADGITWGSATLCFASSSLGSWGATASNVYVLQLATNQYLMYLEGYNGTIYQVALLDSANGTTWTAHGGGALSTAAPLTTLQHGNGSYSAPNMLKVNGIWHMWYHTSQGDGLGLVIGSTFFGPSSFCHAYNPSGDMVTWVQLGGGDPVFMMEKERIALLSSTKIETPCDQVGDAFIFDAGNAVHLYYEVGRNTTGWGGTDFRLEVCRYPHSLTRLMTDLPVLTVGAQTTNAGALAPASPSTSSFTVAVTGTNTNWVVGSSPFSIPLTAAVLTQVITDATHATITITPNGVSGPFVVTDSTTGTTQTFNATAPTSSVGRSGFNNING